MTTYAEVWCRACPAEADADDGYCAAHRPPRMATCSCGKARPSDKGLAFFESRAEGTWSASLCAACGRVETIPAHHPILGTHAYRARGDLGTDSFYCGHAGWD